MRLLVGAAKYKRLLAAGIFNADLYQLHAHLTATGLPSGLMTYVEGEAAHAEHDIVGAEQRLLVRTLKVDRPPETVIAEVDSLASVIRHLAGASPLANVG